MSQQHTPGPWEYWDDNGALTEHCINCGTMEAGYFQIPGGHGNGESTIYTRADARLIAAAPNLLAALEAYVAHFAEQSETLSCCDAIFKQARAAIAKAKRETEPGVTGS